MDGTEHNGAGVLSHQTCEGCVYFAIVARVEHLNPLSDHRCRLPHLARDCIGEGMNALQIGVESSVRCKRDAGKLWM